ncbi:Uncharacterised protein [Sebaldella termitidis]|uniref:Uncharacterized protein n=1 Tax=Sebaldella termitidis (strain ATCC 33386 / NCTC 11300) TaxID=526218 RepID=D1AHE5_SEBTE|nr:hypothetical protein [Sebaldella termitidis]ACZ08179.1 hypothetical protein Sterm_1313 [Sebaldella termitidis ATCC 33386]SUI23482.1 Uncharacterised protein [Sebaldella termitidis]
MGDWSYEPWGNDEAADWFGKFWKNGKFIVLIDEIENFDEREERYDSLRAAAYLLQTLGVVYIWPVEYLNKLKPLLDKTIIILNNMINPPDENWAYLEMGGDKEKLMQAVKEQIDILKERRKDII